MRAHYDVTLVAAGALVALVFGCSAKHGVGKGHADGAVTYDSSSEDGPGADGGAGGAEAAGIDGGFELVGAPLIFAPTKQGFGLNVVLRSGDPLALGARVRDEASLDWFDLGTPSSPAADVAQWQVSGLAAGRDYGYEIRMRETRSGVSEQTLYSGRAVTMREAGSPFTFAVLSDSHIQPRNPLPRGNTVATDFYGFDESTLQAVAADIASARPDFLIHLGDMLDFHLFGFNDPPPDSAWSRLAYLNYRRLLGDTLGKAAHYAVVGNWDGENGCNGSAEIQLSSSQRMLYVPGPHPDSYAQGGSPTEDYYAFSWGDALFIVLNVMTYTPTCHLLSSDIGRPDDWTLGDAQRNWLAQTLAGATSKWRFLFIHHTVGGAAGDAANSAYGRGGGQAARVGEQSWVHDLMLKYGVQIFFYGHDHVFTDMAVDGIHYSSPGSAGAPWKFDSSITGYAHYWPDSGYGRVTVKPQNVQVDFVALGGTVLNSYILE